jgi:hypothetical protein
VSDFDAVRVVLDKTLRMQDLVEQRWQTGEPPAELRTVANDLHATVEQLDEADRQRLRDLADILITVTE